MLLGYGAKNIWSFNEWMQIDLELNKLVPSDVSMNLPAATAMCFKGANASGKTNGIKVLAFIIDFLTGSFSYKPDEPIHYDSYFHNSEQSEVYLQFSFDSKEYLYEGIITKTKVIEEKLSCENELVFLREENFIKLNKFFTENISPKFRDNASFISILNQYDINEIKGIYNYLRYKIVLNVGYMGVNSTEYYDYHIISKIYNENPEIFKEVKEIIKRFDTGVDDIEIYDRTNESGVVIYYPKFVHKNSKNEILRLNFEMESKGTQTLYRILLNFFSTLEQGGVIVLDEMDEYLDPEILPYLLEYYIKEEKNPKHSQLICTIHSPEILDISGKYRTYFFKKTMNESVCYRLDEVKKLRNDRSILNEFKKHNIGGYPEIG